MGLVKYDNEQKKRLRENLKKFTEEQGLEKKRIGRKARVGLQYSCFMAQWRSFTESIRNRNSL